MSSGRSRSLLLAALLTTGLVVAISCSLAGLSDPPPASSSSSASSSSAGSGGSDGGGGDAVDAGVDGRGGGGGATAPKLIYEAEDAGIFGKYVIQSDPDASNGEYVIVPADAGSCSNDDYVVFNVTVSADGTYLIWTRVIGTGLHNDTFFVSADMGPYYMVRTSVLGEWVEDAVFDDTADVTTPIHYQWEAGAHQIIVVCRADDVSLDRIRLEAVPP
jgi:hypothetical protein